MKNYYKLISAACMSAAIGQAALAVPSLQVGAPAGPGDSGLYADYDGSLSDPTETDTAVTQGNTLLVAASYSNGNTELQIGGQYTDPLNAVITPNLAPGTTGDDWSAFGFNAVFNGKGAVVLAVAPKTAGASLTLNGNSPFYTSDAFEDGWAMPNPPSNHDPVKDTNPDKVYMFFDVGNFGMSNPNMPNFVDESTSGQAGEIKSLSVAVSGFEWVHFDLFALISTEEKTGGSVKTYFVGTELEGNPGSKDVTWKEPDGPGPGPDPNTGVPEPISAGLGMMGLVGLGISLKRRQA